MPEIELTSATTATGIWALHDIVIWPNGDAPRRLRPLPRDLREGRRRVADHVVEADPPPHGLRRARGELMPVAVVTGGASGFGLALAERCAALGHGRRAARPRRRAGRRRGRPRSPRPTASTPSGSASTSPTRRASRPPPPRSPSASVGADLVVSNVGVQLFGAVEAFTDDEWRWVLDVNVIGSARVARAFLPLLRRAEPGRLAFTTSSSILDPGQPARRLPGQQVRGVGPGRDAAPRAGRRRHRRVGDLPVGDDHPPPRDERGRPARPPPPADRRRRRLRRHDRQQPRRWPRCSPRPRTPPPA